jgi:N-acyl homoserine lactone hydrolase
MRSEISLFEGAGNSLVRHCRTLRERRLPRNAFDREAMLASLDRLEALERSGARIFFGHDPDFWRAVPQAPTSIA